MTAALTVRDISPAEHLAWVRAQPSVSFLQTPAWGVVKREWRAESIGWFDGEELVGAALVLHRSLPRIGRSLAYIPEGPCLDWSSPRLLEMLRALRDHLKGKKAFALRMGPPVATHRWRPLTIKESISDGGVSRYDEATPDVVEPVGTAVVELLRRLGFEHLSTDDGFTAGQPEYVFQIPLAGRSESDLLAGMNQLWRRNIKKTERNGVSVRVGGPEDVAAFHRVYLETAERDRFTPRPLEYFTRMYAALSAEDPDRIRVYLAEHDGDVVAGALWIRVGGHAWYAYGASTSDKRELQGSTALQWRMIRDSLAAGAAVYDLRGITTTLDADNPHIGLIRFKVGTGGEAVRLAGEWDLPLNRLLYAAFSLYLRRR
ncbi:MAG TPA: peptidoglycan bridge formation glycyltransferase FemA/FemB family protein [Intrasporangium sp.]|uniref:lipid II:glycine glycyltransferase FemX n=1 Tax=Intrasporangium sp. TaxID=1925024 RepID=UPI002D79467D|nr:peptidoglycan bridge formation glycyltransferase FemA/FemB family protein [Intrasporangium sp.]HET7398072.1 peptidoglycan bridge formation glycyltransferase FemA/FemB family protein [Intrasporangium sp.]